MQLRQNVETWERVASIAVGAALVGLAVKRHKTFGGAAMTGLGLLGRGVGGYCPANAALGRTRHRDDTRQALGGSRGVRLRESITISKPPSEVFAIWKDPERFPHFMRHVEQVEDRGGGRTHWKVRGPGGLHFEWDAETINEVEPEVIAWRSLPGADVASAGSVHFRPRRGGTEVTVTMQYDPPGGKAGNTLASLLGQSPAADLREDLRRFKQLLETGEVPRVDGQPTGPRSAVFNAARWATA